MAEPNASTFPPVSADGVPAVEVDFTFDNTYARLPSSFYVRLHPAPVASPSLIKLNRRLAYDLGLDPTALASREGVQILAGSRVAKGAEPLAIAYAGHQFGQFVPQLGDGRANLLGEVLGRDGRRYDIQLKGSGRTPFSRGGDGRAALGPVLREYIVSEAMATFGIPSTRALAAVLTGETVLREGALPGAVLARVASSHIRVGTFEYFAARQDTGSLRTLATYAMERHYPEAAAAERPYRAFLDGVVVRQAGLIAQWMNLGFVHGVMNTDNTSVAGETIDYGPCAFLEAYQPDAVFSSIDRQGRYAFGNQPQIALWNLTRLAETLLPLLAQEERGEERAVVSAQEALATFAPTFEAALSDGLRRKLGLLTAQQDDLALAQELLGTMAAQRADFTLTFHRLGAAALNAAEDRAVRSLFSDPEAYDAWAVRWRSRLSGEEAFSERRAAVMARANPVYIPRNHLVEAALKAAVEQENFEPFDDLLRVLANPFESRLGLERYAAPATPEEAVRWTFCGT